MQITVGVRDLKTNLSDYLRQVKVGETVIITKHGRPIGRIVPEAQSIQAKLELLNQTGLIAWSGKKLLPMAPVAQAKGTRTVTDLLLEDRQ